MALLLIATAAKPQSVTNVNFNPSTIYECSFINVNIFGTYPNGSYVPSFYLFDVTGSVMTLTWNADGTGSGAGTPFNEPVPPLGPWTAGTYTFVVNLVLNGVQSATYSEPVTVLPAPTNDPGMDTFVSICNAGPSIPLITLMDGTPTPGGQWIDPFGNNHSPTFVPGIDQQGVWLYSFDVQPPCLDTSAQLFISYLPNNDPGISNFVAICVGATPVDLFTVLLGSPQTGGTWTGPGGSPFNGTYNPAVHNSGPYTYSVPGLMPCPDPFAVVTVTEIGPSNAGTGGLAEICFNDTGIALNGFLSGGPLQDGTWYDPLGFNFGGWNALFHVATDFLGNYSYTQTVPGCPSATAVVTVSIVSTPNCYVSVSELTAGVSHFVVAPNPTLGSLAIEIAFDRNGDKAELTLLNAAGQMVDRQWISQRTGTMHRQVLDLREQPKGLYLLQVRTDMGITSRQVVLQ